MPKKTSKRQSAKAAMDGTDDDFDQMLAEVMAADPPLADADRTRTQTTASSASTSVSGDRSRSSSSSSSSSQASSTPEGTVPPLRQTVSDEAIIHACIEGNIALLRRWGHQGVRVQSAEPLIDAVFNGAQTNILRCLINELGADVNSLRSDGVTAVFCAACFGFLALMRCLAQEFGADVNLAATDGFTPLYIAAQNGHLAVVRCLVNDLGADVNQASNDGATPLCVAAKNGHLAVVRLLVEEFVADVNRVTNSGATPLSIAAQYGRLEVVRLLVKEFGVDVNQATSLGTTPLYLAAQENHLDLARCLVKELGANVNQATHKGYTPLMVAAEEKNKDVLEFLIKYGASPQISSPNGDTAADFSKSFGAPADQTAYLEARTHCANPGCSGAGVKKCAGCLKVYYCARECQLAHWSAHKKECRMSAEFAASKKK